MNNTMNVTIMGRLVGTATGWDQSGDTSMQFYDFEPAIGVSVPMDTNLITWDYLTGTVEFYNHDGTVVLATKDAIEWMQRVKPA